MHKKIDQKLELIQQTIGCLLAIISFGFGMLMAAYGELFQGLGFLLLAIALLPLFELPILVRVIAAIAGLVFL